MNISYFPAKDNQSYDDAGCVVQGGGCTVTHSQSGTGEPLPGYARWVTAWTNHHLNPCEKYVYSE